MAEFEINGTVELPDNAFDRADVMVKMRGVVDALTAGMAEAAGQHHKPEITSGIVTRRAPRAAKIGGSIEA